MTACRAAVVAEPSAGKTAARTATAASLAAGRTAVLLLGLQLMPVWMLVLLCIPSCRPGLPPAFLPFSPTSISRVPTALRVHTRRIASGDIDAFTASARLKKSLPQAPVVTHSWYCARKHAAARGKAGSGARGGAVAAPMLLNPAESSGLRRPSHTAASAWPLHLLSSIFMMQQSEKER